MPPDGGPVRVSASSAIRWQGLRRAGGDGRPKPQGGDRLSRRKDAHTGLIAAALDEMPDITLPELKERLVAQGASTSVTAPLTLLSPARHQAQKDGPRGRAWVGAIVACHRAILDLALKNAPAEHG